ADEGARTDRDEAGLDEGQRHSTVRPDRLVSRQNAFAVIRLDLRAVAHHQRFDFGVLEASARDDERRGDTAAVLLLRYHASEEMTKYRDLAVTEALLKYTTVHTPLFKRPAALIDPARTPAFRRSAPPSRPRRR